MGQRYTVYVLSNSGSTVKQMVVSKAALLLLSLLLLGCAICFGYMSYRYQGYRQAITEQRMLEETLANREDEVAVQRRQIQKFAADLNALKSKVIALNQFERKIRIIANFETADDESNLFGIGGAIPEDLAPQIPLTESHNSMMREMHAQTAQLDLAAANQKAGYDALIKKLDKKVNLLACTPAIRPTNGWVTSRFGSRTSPFTGRREVHKGLDIASRQGTPIVATADGVITFAGKKGLLGKAVVIDHGHGMVTRYGHIHKILKKKGDRVKRGDKIALVGNTGRSTGPHVHYEVRVNGVPVNPTKYILN